jgi:elongator complex protein 5
MSLSDYSPPPLTLLSYVATTVLTLHSFAQFLVKKVAADRGIEAPPFGLEEVKESVVKSIHCRMKSNQIEPVGRTRTSVIIEMEHRRKSGRSLSEWYLLTDSSENSLQYPKAFQTARESFILLDDHPLVRTSNVNLDSVTSNGPQSTFSLSLTERQKREREGVVLPYFDAQKTGGEGGGGRILYDMGVEDDFDEEEDEI